MPESGQTRVLKGRNQVYTESSKSPGTFYWKTQSAVKPSPKASQEEIQTRNLASTARQIGGPDAARQVYQTAGYTGTPTPETRPTTFNVGAAQGVLDQIRGDTAGATQVSPTASSATGGITPGAASTGVSSIDSLRTQLLAEIQGNTPASFSDELAKKVNEKLNEQTKGLESLRGDIVAGQAQRLTTPEEFIMGRGYSPEQISRLKRPEELGARARLASIDARISDRQSRVDKAIEAVGNMEGERKRNNITMLQTLLTQQQQDVENANALRTLDLKEKQILAGIEQTNLENEILRGKAAGKGKGGDGGKDVPEWLKAEIDRWAKEGKSSDYVRNQLDYRLPGGSQATIGVKNAAQFYWNTNWAEAPIGDTTIPDLFPGGSKLKGLLDVIGVGNKAIGTKGYIEAPSLDKIRKEYESEKARGLIPVTQTYEQYLVDIGRKEASIEDVLFSNNQ